MATIYVFDLDDTLWDGVRLLPWVENFLKYCSRHGYVYLASFNPVAPWILELLGIKSLFRGGSYGAFGRTKWQMIKEICRHHTATIGPIQSIYFYDDLESNVRDVTEQSKKENIPVVVIKVVGGVRQLYSGGD